jgi:NADH dehydrogenase/NADH oxidase (H2O2-forming)
MDACSEAEKNLTGNGLVVFAVGMRPNVELFKNTRLAIERDGIIVNEKMETSIKGVYAAGDCVQFVSGITRKITSGKLATNAVPMARVVAANLLGGNQTYKGFFNGAATKVENLFLGGSGISEKFSREICEVSVGYSELTTTFPIMPEAKNVRLKLITDKNTRKIIGGQVVSGTPSADKIDLITMAIQHGLTVDDLMDFSYSAQPYQSFFPASNLLVAAAEDARANL